MTPTMSQTSIAWMRLAAPRNPLLLGPRARVTRELPEVAIAIAIVVGEAADARVAAAVVTAEVTVDMAAAVVDEEDAKPVLKR